MNENELEFNRQLAKERTERWFEIFQYAQERQNLMSDGFRRLQIQIASILFGFMAAFLTANLKTGSWNIKVMFLVSLGALGLSLLCGLVNEHSLYAFWHDMAEKTRAVSKGYDEARVDGLIDKAEKYRQGVTLERASVDSPKIWWSLQSIFLAIGFILVFGVLIELLMP
jgi:hypothetical protein